MPNVMNGKTSSQGFTLVEMSIVLVIIGLIIGGILKGQEVIASARQKAVINQINAVRSATNTYFDRYRSLPGDDPTAQTTLGAAVNCGDGSGIVGATQATAAALNSADGSSGENYYFFDGLMAANLLNGGVAVTKPATVQFGVSALPAAPITGAGLTVVYGTSAGVATSSKTAHWLRLHKGAAAAGMVAAISPRTVSNIDTQTDDGQADNGGVRGDDTTACNTAAGAQTYAASDNATCIPIFEISQ